MTATELWIVNHSLVNLTGGLVNNNEQVEVDELKDYHLFNSPNVIVVAFSLVYRLLISALDVQGSNPAPSLNFLFSEFIQLDLLV